MVLLCSEVNFIVMAKMKCAQLRGPRSRCPSCLSLEIGLLSLEVHNSSLVPLFLLLLILFQYEMFPDSGFMLIYTQVYLHLVYLTFILFNISTKRVLEHSCYDPFSLHFYLVWGYGINEIKGGFTTKTPQKQSRDCDSYFPFCYFFLFFNLYVYTSWN